MPKSELERLAVMEQRMETINSALLEIKVDLKTLIKNIANGDYDRRLLHLEHQTTFTKWAAPILASILSSVMTFLIVAYLQR